MWGSSNLTAVPTRYGSGLGLQPLSCCSKGGHLGEYAGWISRIHYHKDNSEQCQRQRLLCFNGNSNPVETVQYIYPSIPAGAQNQTITYDGLQVTTAYGSKFICRKR